MNEINKVEENKVEENKIEENEINDSEENNVIYVGRREDYVYVTKGLVHFTNAKSKELIIKARGMLIPKTIYIADEIARNVSDIHHRIEVGIEKLGDNRVSWIEIHLSKFAYVT